MADVDIMFLVGRIRYTREALRAAWESRHVACEALKAADTVVDDASRDFEAAQNALVVAAGGVDRSFMLGLTPPDIRLEVAHG